MPIPESLNPDKARTAARRSDRPGEDCAAEPGRYAITIDRNRCEGKGDCVDVCPYGVFAVSTITEADFTELSFLGKLKSRAHRKQTAYTPKLDACRACGMCVVACPEHALALVAPDR